MGMVQPFDAIGAPLTPDAPKLADLERAFLDDIAEEHLDSPTESAK